MADTSSKRQREESQPENSDAELANKKHKSSITDILSLLEEEEDEPTQDISSLITTLEQEISPAPDSELDADAGTLYFSSSTKDSSSDEEDEKERVMRHLLEASDDELGLPSIETAGGSDGVESSSGEDGFSICDGLLWELEDEAANYYTLIQSELFM